MKDLSIQVSSIANVVSNGDFEMWSGNTPLNWVATNNDGSVGFANTLWGLGVQLVVPEDTTIGTSDLPYISHIISSSDLTNGDSYTIGYWKKNGTFVGIYRVDTGAYTNNGEGFSAQGEWEFKEFNFQYDSAWGDIEIRLRKYQDDSSDTGNTVCYFDNVFIYNNDWYDNRENLNINQIKHFENFQREIEDDLFTFKSDSLSFTIRNYGSDGSYFNTEDFETYSSRIFRFDITATYGDPDGSDIVKKMVMFSNNDTITKTRTPLTNDLTIQLYELATLFKDNGWFMGQVVTDEERDETFFKYNTYDGTDPSIVANNISVADTLTNLQSDIRSLIQRHFIPVPLNNFVINNEIENSGNTINVNYDWLVIDEDELYSIIDIFVSPEKRTFLMMTPYYYLSTTATITPITIWEVINGSTIVQIELDSLSFLTGRIGWSHTVGFIHDTSTSSVYLDGEAITFGIYISTSSGTIDLNLYTNNAGKPNNNPNDWDIQRILNWDSTFNGDMSLMKTLFFDTASGFTTNIGIRDSYNPIQDNSLWISNIPNFDSFEGTYTVSNITTATNASLPNLISYTTSYATTLNADITRFPLYYTFIFKDTYPSDVLKDLCVSQDAIWYLDYATTDGNLTLTIKNRPESQSGTVITDNTALREDSFVQVIKFDDIDGTLFREDATRMNYYLSYYNSTYGGGRFEKEFEQWGYRDYELGEGIEFDNNFYFVKRFELYTNERKTLITLFQKGGLMKIPFGYGYCNIQFWADSMPDGDAKNLDFKIDHDSTYQTKEISETWNTLARSHEKDVYGYHVEFDLKLIDYSLESSSTQQNLIDFIYYYNLNTYKDKRFLIYPYASSGDFWSWENRLKIKYEVITLEYPTLTNIAEHVSKGQYLTLKLVTKAIIDTSDYNYLMYRNTSDGSWNSLPVSGEGGNVIFGIGQSS